MLRATLPLLHTHPLRRYISSFVSSQRIVDLLPPDSRTVLGSKLQNIGIEYATPIQTHALPDVFKRKHVVAAAETSAGKTLVFALPLAAAVHAATSCGKNAIAPTESNVLGIVIVPSQELVLQTAGILEYFGVRVFVPNPSKKGMDVGEARNCHAIVSTPGNFQTLGAQILSHAPNALENGGSQISPVKKVDSIAAKYQSLLRNVRFVAIDEADYTLSAQFQREIETLLTAVALNKQADAPNTPVSLPKKQSQSFTFPRGVQFVCCAATFLPSTASLLKQFRPNVDPDRLFALTTARASVHPVADKPPGEAAHATWLGNYLFRSAWENAEGIPVGQRSSRLQRASVFAQLFPAGTAIEPVLSVESKDFAAWIHRYLKNAEIVKTEGLHKLLPSLRIRKYVIDDFALRKRTLGEGHAFAQLQQSQSRVGERDDAGLDGDALREGVVFDFEGAMAMDDGSDIFQGEADLTFGTDEIDGATLADGAKSGTKSSGKKKYNSKSEEDALLYEMDLQYASSTRLQELTWQSRISAILDALELALPDRASKSSTLKPLNDEDTLPFLSTEEEKRERGYIHVAMDADTGEVVLHFGRPAHVSPDNESFSSKQRLIENERLRVDILDALGKKKHRAKPTSVESEDCVMIFMNDASSVEKLKDDLLKEIGHLRIRTLTKSLTPTSRSELLEDMMDGKIDILICTDVASRGLDTTHVAHVINAEVPESLASFLHRAGRTARAGGSGKLTNIALASELPKLYTLQYIASKGINDTISPRRYLSKKEKQRQK